MVDLDAELQKIYDSEIYVRMGVPGLRKSKSSLVTALSPQKQ
jgi:hypothetical protein